MDDLILGKDSSTPIKCDKCNCSDLEYMGLGGYMCKDCGHKMFDDYGKVREYLDLHRGATATEVSVATGVPVGKIRQMVREEKFEITQNSAVFMACEKCGKPIRSGRFCVSCSDARTSSFEAAKKASRNSNLQGFGAARTGSSGEKRFTRGNY